MKNIIFLLALICLATAIQAQNTAKEKLLKALDEINITTLPQGKTAYNIRYKMRVQYQDKDMETQVLNYEMKVTADQSHLVSNHVSYFRDKEHAFAIVQKQHKIIWMSPDYGMLSAEKVSYASNLKKEFYNRSSIRILPSKQDENKKLYIIIPKTEDQEITKIEKILVELNEKENQVSRMSISFKKDASVYKLIDYQYGKIDFQARLRLKQPVKNLIFTPQGTLRPEYTNYQLIDSRNHSKK